MSADIRRRHRAIQDELLTLQRLNLITADQRQQLSQRYPTTATDLLGLVRWFTIVGSVGAGLGLLLLLGSNINLYSLIEGGCVLLFFGLLGLARLARGVGVQQQRLHLRRQQRLPAAAVDGLHVQPLHLPLRGARGAAASVRAKEGGGVGAADALVAARHHHDAAPKRRQPRAQHAVRARRGVGGVEAGAVAYALAVIELGQEIATAMMSK
mgnify:CR=1 FL=1